MPKVDFTQIITDIEGKPLKTPNDKNEPIDLTLMRVATTALMAPEERQPSAEVKMRRWELARKILNEKTVDLTSAQVTELEDLINKSYGTVVVGPAYLMLEGKWPVDAAAPTA